MIPNAALAAAIAAVRSETYGAEWATSIAVVAVKAAAPHMLRSAADAIVANCPLDECAPAVNLLRELAR